MYTNGNNVENKELYFFWQVEVASVAQSYQNFMMTNKSSQSSEATHTHTQKCYILILVPVALTLEMQLTNWNRRPAFV